MNFGFRLNNYYAINNWRELLLGPTYFYHKIQINRSKKRFFEPNTIRTEKNIEIRSKKDYLMNLNNYENTFFRFLTRKVSTGGTSGSPFFFYRSIFISQKERAYIFDIWRSINYKPFDLRVIFRGNISKDVVTYNWLENAYVLSPNHLTSGNRNLIIKFLKNLKPFFLHVYPSSFFSLINYLGEDIVKSLNIKGILAGSESFPDGQMELVSNIYKLPIAYWYGHSEYAVLARYCIECHGFHFYPTYGKVDFIERDNCRYSIIASSHNKIGTRFINYDTEDLAIMDDIKCGVDNFPRIKNIIGRNQDFFFSFDGSIHAFGPYLFGIHNKFWEYLIDIQFVQEIKGELVVYICTTHPDHQDIEKILNYRFRMITLRYVYVKSIDKVKNGKHSYFIQTIKNETANTKH
jgi:phenylacetate-coenzyme A ligase PaaK-like adenylate-forming protein